MRNASTRAGAGVTGNASDGVTNSVDLLVKISAQLGDNDNSHMTPKEVTSLVFAFSSSREAGKLTPTGYTRMFLISPLTEEHVLVSTYWSVSLITNFLFC